MDKRIKIQIIELSKESKEFRYKVLEGECTGIFVEIMKRAGGSLYIDKPEDDNGPTSQKEPKLWIVVHSIEDFLCGGRSSLNGKSPFAQDLLQTSSDNNREMLPIVHISTTTLILPSMYTMEPLHRLIPRYYLIVDNSIWNYHISIFEPGEIVFPENDPNTEFVKTKLKSFRDSFYDAITSINNNYEKYLYGLHVSREYADLNARLASQSYLTGAHAKGVSPFVFHSEGAVKMMIENEFKVDKDNSYSVLQQIKDQKWRILLVDDKAKEKMECVSNLKPSPNDTYNSSNGDLPWNCKLTIIEKALYHCFNWDEDKINIIHRPFNETKGTENGCRILIEYAQSLDDAKKAIKQKKYDIVLLDYFLDQPDGIHYGYELLDEIYRDQDSNKNDEEGLTYKTIRPHHHQRMYCMFISAYSSAVHDRLLAEGLNLSEKYWFINLGACPTNTPQLFLYNLIKLMKKRLDDSNVENLSIRGVMNVVKNIYGSGESVRKNASELYYKVQSFQYYYRNLLKDYDISVGDSLLFKTNKSVMVTNFLNSNINLGGLLEHLAQLVHLTGFGTIRQWREMWEEYLYVKAQLESLIANEENDKRKRKELMIVFDNICHSVEDYIRELKSEAL